MRNDVLTALSFLAMGLLAVVPSTAADTFLDSMGAPKKAALSELYAYPNPATRSAPVTFHASIDEAATDVAGAEFTVFDTVGQKIKQFQVSGSPRTIGNGKAYETVMASDDLASGAYFVMVKIQKEGGSTQIARKTFVVVR